MRLLLVATRKPEINLIVNYKISDTVLNIQVHGAICLGGSSYSDRHYSNKHYSDISKVY